MAQQYAFLAFGNTITSTVGATAVTLTVGTSATGLPATAVRIFNAGTAAVFIMNGTSTTITAGSNALPCPQSVAPFVIRTGGVTTVQLQCASTFTVTAYVTGGEGID